MIRRVRIALDSFLGILIVIWLSGYSILCLRKHIPEKQRGFLRKTYETGIAMMSEARSVFIMVISETLPQTPRRPHCMRAANHYSVL